MTWYIKSSGESAKEISYELAKRHISDWARYKHGFVTKHIVDLMVKILERRTEKNLSI